MTKVLVVYASTYGNTKKLADAIAVGVKSVEGCSCSIAEALDATKEQLLDADALILGSPVHMGSPDWRIKKFIDDVCSHLWMKDLLVGKVGGVFCSGGGFGSAGGGCEVTLLAMLSNLAELGMIIVPLPKNTPGYAVAGLQWGVYGQSMAPNMEQTGVTDEMCTCALNHGANIARVTKTFLKGKLESAKSL